MELFLVSVSMKATLHVPIIYGVRNVASSSRDRFLQGPEARPRTSFNLSAEIYPPSAFQHKNLAGTPDYIGRRRAPLTERD